MNYLVNFRAPAGFKNNISQIRIGIPTLSPLVHNSQCKHSNLYYVDKKLSFSIGIFLITIKQSVMLVCLCHTIYL